MLILEYIFSRLRDHPQGPETHTGGGSPATVEVIIRVPPARSYNAGRAGLMEDCDCLFLRTPGQSPLRGYDHDDAALDPPLWTTVSNKSSLSLSLITVTITIFALDRRAPLKVHGVSLTIR